MCSYTNLTKSKIQVVSYDGIDKMRIDIFFGGTEKNFLDFLCLWHSKPPAASGENIYFFLQYLKIS